MFCNMMSVVEQLCLFVNMIEILNVTVRTSTRDILVTFVTFVTQGR